MRLPLKKAVLWLVFAAAAALFAVTAVLVFLRTYHSVEGWSEPLPTSAFLSDQDAALLRRFADTTVPDTERYKLLFNYFLAGFLEFSTPLGERVFYPGVKGNNGHSVEGLEGFARTAPLFAAWLASGRPPVVADPRDSDRQIDLRHLLRRAVLTGTDPRSASYWGDIADYDQRIVEAADVALLLWLSRDQVWSGFSPAERKQVARWLRQVETRAVHPNNWLLFKVQVIEALRALDMPADARRSSDTYGNFKGLYLGSGWFSDPPKGVDFYNPWAISYSLFWIDQMNPSFDRVFIRGTLRKSALLVLHLVGPNGVPMMGRSQCYRMAIPAPVVIQSALEDPAIHPGQARRALDVVWRYFVERGGVAQGRAEQGYYRADPRFLERYSGPGSCQWSLRSLVPAFFQPKRSPFWQAPQQPLPIELADYRIALPELGWIVTGDQSSGEIVIRIPANGDRQHAIHEHGVTRRLAEFLLETPFRPRNDEAKYGNGTYSSQTAAAAGN